MKENHTTHKHHFKVPNIRFRERMLLIYLIGGIIPFILVSYFTNWSVILSRDIRCFGVALKLAADVRPILTTNTGKPIETITNQYIKIEFRFVPLAGVGFTQRLQQQ